MTDQFETKKYISISNPSKESPLSYVDLLVYCYRANQDQFDTVPSFRRVAKATGLKEQTVSDATSRLIKFKLLTEECEVFHPCPNPNWFITLDKLKLKNPDGPEFRWRQNWRTYVRAPGESNPLTVPCVLIYSVLRHSVLQKWKPLTGWSHEYLALITATNAKTVATALTTLEQKGLLEVHEGCRFQLFKLKDYQMAYFADKNVFQSGTAEPDDIVDEYSPKAQGGSQLDDESRQALRYIYGCEINQDDKTLIYAQVKSAPTWPQGWREHADALIARKLEIAKAQKARSG